MTQQIHRNIEVFDDRSGQWRFRVVGDNGEIVATSEGYTRRADAQRGARALVRIMASTGEAQANG